MIFEILTLFPAMFEGVFADSIIKRALEKRAATIRVTNMRDFSHDERHQSVDDYPYGGGAGMVLKAQPVADAIRASKARVGEVRSKVILLAPRGQLLTHEVVQELLSEEALILVCGRYKGIDQRVRDAFVDRELSIGDYVLSGGEIPAMVVVDAVTRLLPGVLGDRESAESDSFYEGLLGPPQYTRPEVYEGMEVPSVLLSGHHANIRKWQREQSVELTRRVRPDLWERYSAGTRHANDGESVREQED